LIPVRRDHWLSFRRGGRCRRTGKSL